MCRRFNSCQHHFKRVNHLTFRWLTLFSLTVPSAASQVPFSPGTNCLFTGVPPQTPAPFALSVFASANTRPGRSADAAGITASRQQKPLRGTPSVAHLACAPSIMLILCRCQFRASAPDLPNRGGKSLSVAGRTLLPTDANPIFVCYLQHPFPGFSQSCFPVIIRRRSRFDVFAGFGSEITLQHSRNRVFSVFGSEIALRHSRL